MLLLTTKRYQTGFCGVRQNAILWSHHDDPKMVPRLPPEATRAADDFRVRLRALLGGLAIVATVAVSRRPVDGQKHHRSSDFCVEAGAAGFCDAVAGLQAALRDPALQTNRASVLPPATTPGAIDPAVTQANIGRTICRPGYARAARPSFAITDPYKRQLMAAQHPDGRMADYELDHLIPVSIGGAPFDRRDLWLQPRRGRANAGDKNDLAYVLWRLVCEHRVPLRTAQRAISRDWTKAYAIYATPENIARYHFRHGVSDDEKLRIQASTSHIRS